MGYMAHAVTLGCVCVHLAGSDADWGGQSGGRWTWRCRPPRLNWAEFGLGYRAPGYLWVSAGVPTFGTELPLRAVQRRDSLTHRARGAARRHPPTDPAAARLLIPPEKAPRALRGARPPSAAQTVRAAQAAMPLAL